MLKPFKASNKAATKRTKVGRPKRMTTSIAEVTTPEELRALLRLTFERAMAGEATSLQWILGQLPKLDSGFRLPAGLPPLNTLVGTVEATGAIGEMARTGAITVADAEKSLALISAIAFARVSILSRAAERLDAELREVVERERQLEQRLERQAAPAWSPGTDDTLN